VPRTDHDTGIKLLIQRPNRELFCSATRSCSSWQSSCGSCTVCGAVVSEHWRCWGGASLEETRPGTISRASLPCYGVLHQEHKNRSITYRSSRATLRRTSGWWPLPSSWEAAICNRMFRWINLISLQARNAQEELSRFAVWETLIHQTMPNNDVTAYPQDLEGSGRSGSKISGETIGMTTVETGGKCKLLRRWKACGGVSTLDPHIWIRVPFRSLWREDYSSI
jgi:hypothetical protein